MFQPLDVEGCFHKYSLENYKSVTLLIDVSESISIDCFNNNVKPLMEGIVCRILDVPTSIITFGERTSQINEFSSNRENLINIIKNIELRRIERGFVERFLFKEQTFILPALEMASNGCNLISQTGTHLMVLITDGRTSDNPTTKIQELKNRNIEFISIAVNNYDTILFDSKFPTQKKYYMETKRRLNDILGNISNMMNPLLSFNSKFKICNVINRSRVDSGLYLDVHIENISNNNKIFPNDLKIEFLPNSFYHGNSVEFTQTLNYGDTETQRICLHAINGTEINKLPAKIYNILTFRGRAYNGAININFRWFWADFITNLAINISINGSLGIGKTRIIQGLINLFTGGMLVSNLGIMATLSDYHVTTNFTKFTLGEILTRAGRNINQTDTAIMESVKINIFDKWGFQLRRDETRSYDENFVVAASEGRVRVGAPINEQYLDQKDPANSIHSFIFVMSLGIGDNTNEFEFYNRLFRQCIERGIQPILVLTNSDRLNENQLNISRNIHEKLSYIDKRNIFNLVPYVEDQSFTRNPEKDLIFYEILKRAVEIGLNTISKNN